MNFNILYEFRLESIFSYILSIILIFYIFKNTPIPNNLNLNSNIKKIYFWISVIFISIIIFLFFNTINVIIFLFIIFEIVDKINTNNIYKEEKRKKEIQIEEERKNRENKKDKKVNIDESKNITVDQENVNEEKDTLFTLEEGIVNQSYILAQSKQLANPTPKYQAILPDINCSYLN
jgi:flagellar biosynthesis/type III secretory pathway M-ring protein FliF/YscJ